MAPACGLRLDSPSSGQVDPGRWGLLVTRLALHSVVLVVLLLPHLSPVVALPAVEIDRLYPLVPSLYLSTAIFAYWSWQRPHSRGNVAAQLFSDGFFLAWLTALTGGAGSPFTFLYLVLIGAVTWLLAPYGGAIALAGGITTYVGVGCWCDGIRSVAGVVPFLNQEVVLPTLLAFVATTGLTHLFASRQEIDRRRLAHEEARFTTLQAFHTSIVQSIHSGLITLDRSLRITSINPSGIEILGWPAARLQGELVTAVFDFPEDFIDRLQAGERGVRLECRCSTASRGECIAGVSLSPLVGNGGHDAGYVVSFQDLTEVKRLEVRVKARAQLAAIGELAARLAHEIRNPLAAISGSVQVIAGERRRAGAEARLLDVVVRESDRLNGLLSEFLSYARPRALCPKPVDVIMVAREVIELLGNDPAAQGVDLCLSPSNEPSQCTLDGEALRQCLTNLVRNALQALPPTAGRVVIGVDGPNERGDLVVRIADNGRGIAPEECERIFFPFHTTKERGTGLGLSVVKSLVEAMGGTLSLSSVPGEGSVFTITLPESPPVQVAGEPQAVPGALPV